jgi:hypothetical protein
MADGSSSAAPADAAKQAVENALKNYDEAVNALAQKIKDITNPVVEVLDNLYTKFDDGLPSEYKWETRKSAAGGATDADRKKKKEKKHKKRHGGDDISNTGTLISSVNPPASYASDSYLSVLQNTPDSTASTMTISNNPAYILPGGDSAYLDRPLHGGKKRT